MANKRDYYEVLGIERTASDREISSAYRKLATKYHPDRHPGDEEATAKFKEASEAYEVLSDRDKRTRYDQYGHAGVEGAGQQFASADDIFEAFGEMFGGGVFGDIFGSRRGRRVSRGADVRVDVVLTLEEAASGIEKSIRLDRSRLCETCDGSGAKAGSKPETCRQCGGSGQILQSAGILRMQSTCSYCQGSGSVISDPCLDCRGTGQVREPVTLNVSIPAGVDDGMRVRIRGEGEPSPNGGPAGDCYCFVRVQPHKIFRREGEHLLIRFPISYPQAALGADIEVPTLEGPHDMNLEPGTQSGDVFRIRGGGVPDPQTGRVGDLLVEVFIETPKKLEPRQEELLRELAELEQTHVSPHRKSFLEKIKDYFSPPETEEAD